MAKLIKYIKHLKNNSLILLEIIIRRNMKTSNIQTEQEKKIYKFYRNSQLAMTLIPSYKFSSFFCFLISLSVCFTFLNSYTIICPQKNFNIMFQIYKLLIMLNYFLREQIKSTNKVKKIIKDRIIHKRKYQPFHIDCNLTKKKLCYCSNNPVMNINMTQETKQQTWNNYLQVEAYYKNQNEDEFKVAQQQYSKLKQKIQSLSRNQVVNFVKSIKKQKQILSEMGEY